MTAVLYAIISPTLLRPNSVSTSTAVASRSESVMVLGTLFRDFFSLFNCFFAVFQTVSQYQNQDQFSNLQIESSNLMESGGSLIRSVNQ